MKDLMHLILKLYDEIFLFGLTYEQYMYMNQLAVKSGLLPASARPWKATCGIFQMRLFVRPIYCNK